MGHTVHHVASHGLPGQLVSGLHAHFALLVKQGLAQTHRFTRFGQNGLHQRIDLKPLDKHTSRDLAGELLKMRGNIDLIHVPYKGAAPAMSDLLGGQVQLSFQTALSAIPHLKSGKLNVIAVASKKRMGILPNVPTMAEAGIADFEVSSWNGLFAPAKTPPHIVNALYNATIKAINTQDIKDKMEAQGAEPVGSSPEEFKAFVKAEIDKWEQVIIKSGAKMD